MSPARNWRLCRRKDHRVLPAARQCHRGRAGPPPQVEVGQRDARRRAARRYTHRHQCAEPRQQVLHVQQRRRFRPAMPGAQGFRDHLRPGAHVSLEIGRRPPEYEAENQQRREHDHDALIARQKRLGHREQRHTHHHHDRDLECHHERAPRCVRRVHGSRAPGRQREIRERVPQPTRRPHHADRERRGARCRGPEHHPSSRSRRHALIARSMPPGVAAD